ncbi:hypothetical protein F1C58_16705 (plasmid) [Glaciihabitans sp. INWT7]|uniref:hypothetical protein n=1 Tax=Glaciihabitans sp. INWT7 TaxID=2596912 RepID=UPI0016283248|nr:hypothetical protein [Glaciihabitans sp. INWT7]QNE48698.1 hypothetical protein F1C58_16705 [Glaciihabitans sp. INWT7]
MEIRRRQFLTSPGESLLLPMQAMAIADRLSRWTRYSNLPKEVIVSSPLLAIPLSKREPGQRWPAIAEPSAFWHPQLWLPERLTAPETGERTDVWAVRVALELTITGLYDVETGTWLDVLSTVGLDSEDPVVQARITEWLEGEPDEDLDRIDLSDGMNDATEVDWSRQQAEDLLALLVPASWAVLSNDLIAMASESLSDEALDIEILTNDAKTILYLAQGSIGDGPAGAEGEESPASLWGRILADLENWPLRPLQTLIDGPFDALVESLYSIRNDYWVFVEALWENRVTADASEGALV